MQDSIDAIQTLSSTMSEITEPKGRARGGVARSASLSPEERSAIARKGAAAKKELSTLPRATHGSEDHPLTIGDVKIPCYVLEDGRRVLTRAGLQSGIGMSTSGAIKAGESRLALFMSGLGERAAAAGDASLAARCAGLEQQLAHPVRFRPPSVKAAWLGYEATILADMCDVILAARAGGHLSHLQEHFAQKAEVLVRGFARVGIIALIDEATGYQKDRAKDALATILEAFIAKELQPWVRTFPAEYYQEMFRLRGLNFPGSSVRRPQYFGVLTNDIVYRRLAPGVLDELRRVTPRNDDGRPTAKYFQSLTSNLGYPKLREHIGKVIAMMQLSTDWNDFKLKLERLLPLRDDQLRLALEGPDENDPGIGL